MHQSLRRLKTVIEHPAAQLTTGLVLLVSGLASAWGDFASAEHRFRLGVHHGVLLWGLVQVLGSLPNLIDGIARSFEAVEKHRQQP